MGKVDFGDVAGWVAVVIGLVSLFGLERRWSNWRASRKITWEATAKSDTTMVLRNTSSRAATNVVVADVGEGWHVKGMPGSLVSIDPMCGVDLFWKDPGRKRRPNQVLVSCDEQRDAVAVPTPW